MVKTSGNQQQFLNFLKYCFIASAVIWSISIYLLYKYASDLQFYSVFAGYSLSFLNAVGGYLLNTSALKKTVKSFMLIIFGGMGIRLLVVMICLILLLVYTQLDSLYLVLSVFMFYTVFISIEILFLHRMQKSYTFSKVSGNNRKL